MRNFKKYLTTLCTVCMAVIGAIALVSCGGGEESSSSVEEIVEVHTHDYSSSTVKETTCTEEGLKKYSCSCGDSYTETIEKLSHEWGAFTIVTEPTCLNGLRERFCSVCGEKDEQVIASLGDVGHCWEEKVIAPTCEEAGSIIYTCLYCGDVYTEYGGPKLGHNWVNDVCTTCNQEACRDLEYRLNDDGASYSLIGVGNCRDKKMYIPSMHNGKPVTSINRAFYGYDWLVRLEIIGNVEVIDYKAGSECSALEEVVMSDSVKTIEQYAFAYSKALKIIEFSVELETIGKYAFYECDSIKEISLPDSVNCVDKYAFAGSEKLTTVLFGNGLEYIGEYVFSDCDGLKEVTISDSVLRIGAYVFFDCDSLETITIPDSVEVIDKYAFSDCDALKSVALGASLQTVGEGAFSSNKSLKEIQFPLSVKNVEVNAFSNNASLETVEISDLAAWCNIVFANGNANPLANGTVDDPTNINNPESAILYVAGEAQTDVVIPDVTSIASHVFYGYYKLNELTISENVASIGNGAFAECPNLTKINYNAIACEIGENVFNHSGARVSVVFGNQVQYVPYRLFRADMTDSTVNIVDVTFEEGSVCESIYAYAFAGCESLTRVVMSDSITGIYKKAFSGCKNLKELTISNSVVKKVPDENNPKVEVWSTTIYEDAFEGCDAIQTLKAHAQAIPYVNITTVSQLTVTDGEIDAHLFENSQVLREVTLGDSVTSVGMLAFANCYNLKKFDAGNAVVTIKQSAFENAFGLTEVNIPNATIEDTAFYRCTSLNNVEVGTGTVRVTIGESAFYCCSALTNLTIGANVEEIGKTAFKGTSLTSVDFGVRIGWTVELAEGSHKTLWSTLLAELDEAATLMNTYCEYKWACTSI